MFQFLIENSSIIANVLAIFGSVAACGFWIVHMLNKRFEISDKRFEAIDKRFEAIEGRIFQLAMGKTLKEAMMEERAK